MARVEKVEKCRKPKRCGRCGKVVEVGQPYYIARRRYLPAVVRCTDCGIEPWETSSSEYVLEVGQIKYRWRDNIGVDEGTAEEIASLLYEIRDGVLERRDALPFEYGPTVDLLDERESELELAIEGLEEVCQETVKAEAVESIFDSECEDEGNCRPDFDDLMDSGEISGEEKECLQEAYRRTLEGYIDEALDNIQGV